MPTERCRAAKFNVSGIVKVSEQMRVDGNPLWTVKRLYTYGGILCGRIVPVDL